MSVIDLNLICMNVTPFARNNFKQKDNFNESRQINFLLGYGLFA